MGKHRDSLPNMRNPSRKAGGMGSSQKGTFMDHQLCHTPGGRYGYRMEHKRAMADALTEARSVRSPQEQITVLDARLGEGEGARKERTRLQELIDNPPKATKKKGEEKGD